MTAYNGAGESALAPSRAIASPLTAAVSGPSALGFKENRTWSASYTGGSGATTYRWFTRDEGSSSWYDTGATGASYTRMMGTTGFDVRVRVTRGSTSDEDELFVAYCSGEFCGPMALSTAAPAVFAVHPPTPNPAQGPVEVRFDLPDAAPVRLALFDMVGREVAVVVDRTVEAGYHRARIETSGLPAGVYVARIEAGGAVGARRITVVR